MARAEALTAHFLEEHPDAAARVLERLPVEDAAALFDSAPARIVAPALRAMLPLHAARCLERVDDAAAAALLRRIGPQAGAAVLRYVPADRRAAWLEALPGHVGMTLRLLLGYPEDTAGAWMNPRVPAAPGDTRVAAALARIRESDEGDASLVYVLDGDQRLIGVAPISALLRAGADVPLHRVARPARHLLPVRVAIAAILDHAGWSEAHALPVVERDDRFVGALDRGTLARALDRSRAAPEAGDEGDVLGRLAAGYWLGVSSLVQLAVEMLPVGGAPRPRGDERGSR